MIVMQLFMKRSLMRSNHSILTSESQLCMEAILTSPNKCFGISNRLQLVVINNSIVDSLSNYKFAWASYITLRKSDDSRISRLRIQLAKYCKTNYLTTTVTAWSNYQLCSRAIFGRLSIVLHCMNIAGVTYTNLNKYDVESKKIVNFDTPKMTHVFNVDFKSLYPSEFWSTSHPFNKYTSHWSKNEASTKELILRNSYNLLLIPTWSLLIKHHICSLLKSNSSALMTESMIWLINHLFEVFL